MRYLLFFVLVTVVGCESAMKTAYGIKKPKIESNHSIKRFLSKQAVDTSYVFVLKDLNSFVRASNMSFLTIPDATFFNKEGHYVPYKDPGVECNANADSFLLDMTTFSKTVSDNSRNMEDVLSLLEIADGKVLPNADINVFITWSIYAGKLNKQKAFEWVRLIEHAKKQGVNINYYLVNCDFQKSWNIPVEMQKSLGIHE